MTGPGEAPIAPRPSGVIPNNVLSQDDELFQRVGQITALGALLENRLGALASNLDQSRPQDRYFGLLSGQSATIIRDRLRAYKEHAEHRPFAVRAERSLQHAEEALKRRHEVVHRVWSRRGHDSWGGHKGARRLGDEVWRDYERQELDVVVDALVAAIQDLRDVIPDAGPLPKLAPTSETNDRVAAPRALASLWGETLAVGALRDAGFQVSWTGGLAPRTDLVVSRDASFWHVRVKTTTTGSGRVAWRKPGDDARKFQASALSSEAAGAFFVLAHILQGGEQQIDTLRRKITIEAPSGAALFGVTAAHLDDDMNPGHAARATMKPREATQIGTVGTQLPVYAHDFEPLETFLSFLSA